jgi:putative DNA primase/helicase
MNAEEAFRSALSRAGLEHAGELIADGRLHRFRSAPDRNRNSWYVLFPGLPAGGAFGCWRRQISEKWSEREAKQCAPAELERLRAAWRQADREREREETARQAKAREVAAWLLRRSEPAEASHPYLVRKAVTPRGELRQRQGGLLLPLRDADGVLHSLQRIGPDGTKRFLDGGRVAGCWFALADKPDGPVIVAEGYATAATVAQATGCAAVAAMSCGNLLAAAQALRGKWPERTIVIAADRDEAGLAKATEAAKVTRAKLAVPRFANASVSAKDFNDLFVSEGIDRVKALLDEAETPRESDEEVICRLAKLPPLQYDKVREEEARRLKVRVGTLDDEVLLRRGRDEPRANATEAWPDEVNGGELLEGLAGEFRRFLVLPAHADTILALVTLHSYSWQQCEYSPILAVTSPVRTCAKSRVLDVLERLVCNPFRTANASEAVLFRIIDSRQPTVLVDEFDSIPEERQDVLTNILKAGFHRSGKVHRVEGESNRTVVEFVVFGPKVVACIKLPLDAATVSRCVRILMQRKKRTQKVDRLRRYDGTEWRRKCVRWTEDHRSRIEDGTAVMPEALDDRAQDIWEPFFVLADLAGGPWPERVKAAALASCGESVDAPVESSVTLLTWIRTYFTETGETKVAAADLVSWLNGREDAPFRNWNKESYDAFVWCRGARFRV